MFQAITHSWLQTFWCWLLQAHRQLWGPCSVESHGNMLLSSRVSFNCDLNYQIILKNIFPQANHTLCFCSLNWPKGQYTWSSGGQHVTSNRTYHNFLGLNPPFTPRREGWEWEEGACSGGLMVMRHWGSWQLDWLSRDYIFTIYQYGVATFQDISGKKVKVGKDLESKIYI